MKAKHYLIVIFLVSVLIMPLSGKSQEYGRFGVGVQRAIWTLFGPSVIIDVHRRVGFETILGVDWFSTTNSNIGVFERLILRPVTYKTNSLYLVGMAGTARWHFMGTYDGDYIEAYEWGRHWGVMAGIELDTRLLFPKFIPLFVSSEWGYEHRETKYTTSNTYFSFGFGFHYRF